MTYRTTKEQELAARRAAARAACPLDHESAVVCPNGCHADGPPPTPPAEGSDDEILATRTAYYATLALPELVAMRERIQEAHGRAAVASRAHAALERRERGWEDLQDDPALAGSARRMRDARAEHTALFNEYHDRMRPAALAAAGIGLDDIARSTSAELRAFEAHRRLQLEHPPIGWGRSMPDDATRRAKWLELSEHERLHTPGPRAVAT